MKTRLLLPLVAITTLFAAPLAVHASSDAEGAAAIHGKVDQTKPLDWKLKGIDGKEIDFEKLRGKVVLVDFWATWCGPCVQEVPKLKEIYEKFKDQGFEIVGISLDENQKDLETFITQRKMTWPQNFEGARQLADKHDIVGIPTVWLVNQEGLVVDTSARQDTAEKIEKLLKK